jgi:hypothetical protein
VVSRVAFVEIKGRTYSSRLLLLVYFLMNIKHSCLNISSGKFRDS